MQEYNQRFIFEDKSVRGQMVRLEHSFAHLRGEHHYPPCIEALLGEMMASAVLLSETIKFSGQMILQIQDTSGMLKLAMVAITSDAQVRGVAKYDQAVENNANFAQLIGDQGVLVISIIPDHGERYQGIIALNQPSLAECLQTYFAQSEQLATQIRLFVGDYEGKKIVAGTLLQIIPDDGLDYGDFEHLCTLMATVQAVEIFSLSAPELLFRLFHQEKVRLFAGKEVYFDCGCSFERSCAALKLLPQSELHALFAEKRGIIDMQCECCTTTYFIEQTDIIQE